MSLPAEVPLPRAGEGTEPGETAESASTARSLPQLLHDNPTVVPFIVLLLAVGLFSAIVGARFFHPFNLSLVLQQVTIIAVVGTAQTLIILTAGIDLSVGTVLGFAGVIISLLLQAHVPVSVAIVLTLLVGVAIGMFHAFGVIRLGLPPFIMTLATLTALRGIGLLMTNGSSISIDNDSFTGFSRGALIGIPNLFWMVIVVAVPSFVFLHLSRWGRYLFAIGSNREAARLSGVSVNAMLYVAYTLSSTFAAFAGILTTSRIGIGNATTGQGWELQSIASSVIGGTSLFGAVGSIHGPLLGSILLTTINNGANLLNVNPFWQLIITGGLIIVIVYFDQLRRRGR